MPEVSFYDPTPVSPERRDRENMSLQEQLALQMIAQGTSSDPVYSPLQGLARALQGPIGAYIQKGEEEKATQAQQARDQSSQRALAEAMALSRGQPGAPPTSQGPQMAPRPANPQAAQQRIMQNPDLARQAAPQVLAQIMAGAEPQKPYSLSPGQERRGPNNQVVARNPAAQKQRRIVKGADGYQHYADTGERVMPGVKMKPPSSGINMQFGDEGRLQSLSTGGAQVQGGIQKKTTGDLEKGVLGDQQVMDRLTYIDSLYDQNFLTYKGAVTGFGADIWNKLDPDQRSQFTQRRSAFASQVHNFSNAYRKWVTGVASSAKEMPLIENAIPNMKDSPQSFESKKASLKQFTRKLMVRKIAALNDGITIGSDRWKRYMEENPMEGIPTLQERGEELEGLGYDVGQIKAILGEEGYRY